MFMAGARPVFHVFSLLTAFTLAASLLGAAAGVASVGGAMQAPAGAVSEPKGDGAYPEVAGQSGGEQASRPGYTSRRLGTSGRMGTGGPENGSSADPDEAFADVPPRPPAACTPAAPLAAAAAAGEALQYLGAVSAEAPEGTLADLEQTLRDFVAGRSGDYGVAVVDLATGATAAVGADRVFVAASTFKVPLAMYVLDLAARGEADLEEQLFYSPEDWEAGTGILHSSVPGDCHTVSELINLALTQSDNIATNMLLRRFGDENVFAYMREIGGSVTNLAPGRRATTPPDMVRYLERAYRLAATEEGQHHRILMGLLTQTAFQDRIAEGAPPGVPVAHKIGTLPAMVHDVGIVFLPEHPFAIAIFSAGVNEQAAAADLARITRIVSEYFAPDFWYGVEGLSGEDGSQPRLQPGEGGGLPREPSGDGPGQPAEPLGNGEG